MFIWLVKVIIIYKIYWFVLDIKLEYNRLIIVFFLILEISSFSYYKFFEVKYKVLKIKEVR